MVMKTYFKSIARSVKSNLAKFISLTAIMLLGIAFVSGLGTLIPTIKDSFNVKMNEEAFPDIIIKATSEYGFTKDQIKKVSELDYVELTNELSSMDFNQDNVPTRIYLYDNFDTTLNKLEIEGQLPSSQGEILVERHNNESIEYKVNDKISIMEMEYRVVGIVSNPLIFERSGEPSIVDGNYLEQIIYFDKDYFPSNLPITDLYISLTMDAGRNYFSASYADEVQAAIEKLKSEFGDTFHYLTIEDNKSYLVFDAYCEKVTAITLFFPAFFIAVAALVVMTTMTRMIEEERLQIGCLKSLGFTDGKITFKYILLVLMCCIIAVILGLLLGLTILPRVIYPAFNVLFFMPQRSNMLYLLPGILSFTFMSVVVLLVTAIVSINRLKEQPAALLNGKAPEAGKTILLEKCGFLWSKLSFKYKSSIRNIFRYKKHLIMTILSVAGSTALAFAGFGLINVAESLGGGSFAGLKDSVKPISIVVIIFGLLLCGFVIYNLTNLNIGERKKEIATLGVLGYHDNEILGYVYREIVMMSIVGDILGIGLGCVMIDVILRYLEFGDITDVKWYSYILAFVLVILFVTLTNFILSPKIKHIEMTSSLKSND